MFQYNGKTALVTGASSGIGTAFAHELANRGMHIVLVARDVQRLEAIAEEIRNTNKVQAYVVPADLGRENAAHDVKQAVESLGLQIDLLVNNAGVMTHGAFEAIESARDHQEVMVNVAAVVGMTHAFLPGMLERQLGGVINIASVAGFQPIPFLAVYAATKAFVISFSVALWEECRSRNVTVLGMCPGTTTTELFERGNAHAAALGKPRTAQQVVSTALKGLDKRRSLVVDGTLNSLLTLGPRLIPRWFAAQCAGKAVKPQRPA